MKRMKKMVSLLLAMVMVIAMTLTASAASEYSITINNAYKGETYSAYKIFDVSYSGSNYSYTINSTGEWFPVITDGIGSGADGSYTMGAYGIKFVKTIESNVYNVVNAVDGVDPTPAQMAELAKKLAENVASKISSGTASAALGAGDGYGATTTLTIDLSPDEAGYYFVNTTTGALCALNTTDKVAVVQEKNSLPTVVKKEALAEGTVASAISYTATEVDVAVGSTVFFEIEVKDGKGTDKDIVIHDKQSSGLTLNTSTIKVYKDAVEVPVGNYTLNTAPGDGCAFELTLNAAYVKTLDTDAKVLIRYNAVLNENALTKSEETSANYNFNKVHLTYSGQTSEDVEVKQHTYKFQLVKDDDTKAILSNAKFKMYDSETGTTPINLVATSNGYRPAKDGEASITEITAGYPIFSGFAPGTYWFEETASPEGYNRLSGRVSITITNADNTSKFELSGIEKGTYEAGATYKNGGLEVVNKTGTELPSTGGIGTTIFYVLGSILLIGAAVLLITKRRMNAEK